MLELPRTSARPWLLVAGLALVVGVAFQGSRGLYETTEGRYAEVAREMRESGNYIEPTLDYRPHWTKPPLAYWPLVAGMAALGQNEWGLRVPVALAFVLTTLAVMGLARALWDGRTALIAGLVYLSSPLPVGAANTVNTDTFLALWETCAVLCYVQAAFGAEGRRRDGWHVGMWAFFGLGFATKGPPALLPLLAIAVWHFRHGRARDGLSLFQPAGLAAFVGLGLTWYFVMALRHPGLASYWLSDEVVKRVASAQFHRKAAWYKGFGTYVPVLALGTGWWLYFAARALWRRRLWAPSALHAWVRGDGPGVFLLAWLALPLAVFLVARSRQPLYVLPLYVPIALAVARGVVIVCGEGRALRTAAVLACCGAALLVGAKGAFALVERREDMGRLYAACAPLRGPGTVFYVWRERHLHGLQFYLDGRMGRLGRAERPARPPALLDELARHRREGQAGVTRVVLIAERDKAEGLERMLGAAGLSADAMLTRYWAVLSIAVPGPEGAPPVRVERLRGL